MEERGGERTFEGTADIPEGSDGYERGRGKGRRPDEVLSDSVVVGQDRNAMRGQPVAIFRRIYIVVFLLIALLGLLFTGLTYLATTAFYEIGRAHV